MKNQRISLICACITLFSLYATAQPPVPNDPDYNKPLAFANFPDQIPVSLNTLDNLINSKTGTSINTVFSTTDATNIFEGTVVSTVSKYDDKLQMVLIKSTNYNGATLSISKVITPEGVTKYHGRMMKDLIYGDIYVLQSSDAGFVLVKKNYYNVIRE